MHKKAAVLWGTILVSGAILASSTNIFAVETTKNVIKAGVVTISVRRQHDSVRPGGKSALAVNFELEKDWHFYASAKTAPGDMNLKIKPLPEDNSITFSQPVWPQAQWYFDKISNKKLEVFSNKFTVFLPFSVASTALSADEPITANVDIVIEGAVCSDIQCRVPDFGSLKTMIEIAPGALMDKPKFTLPGAFSGPLTSDVKTPLYSLWFALGLAFLAGLALNIMPCVWPVLPIIVMRIVEQARQSKAKSVAMGFTFCSGILLFFACLAAANIILHLFYATALQWGDQFRNPGFVAAMVILLIVMAQFCFGVFTIGLPSSVGSPNAKKNAGGAPVAGKAGSDKGFATAVGMGFLAAILGTPCSFAILATAFAWAQAQKPALGTFTIMVIGLGMAAPYMVLTALPGLLKRLPKAGRWMELFKQGIGFVLLMIAVKLIAALPTGQRTNILYFAVVLGFCVWMWGNWVGYSTALSRKLIVRIIAVVLAVSAGLIFLPAPKPSAIDWQDYDADLIEQSLAENRPVLIKFTADWCFSCQVVEKIVYENKDISRLIKQKGVLTIKADTTGRNEPATIALKNLYNEPGVPVSILYVPGQKQPVRWRGINFGDELKKQLENLQAQKPQ